MYYQCRALSGIALPQGALSTPQLYVDLTFASAHNQSPLPIEVNLYKCMQQKRTALHQYIQRCA